jgi:Domain of unknown function (DUF5710)
MPPIDLNVPYHEKDDAKRLGARWDAARKTWFLPDGANIGPFGKWLTSQSDFNLRCSSYFIAPSTRICWRCDRSTLLHPVHKPFEASTSSIAYKPGFFEKMGIVPSR